MAQGTAIIHLEEPHYLDKEDKKRLLDEDSDIPVFKGRKNVKLKVLIKELDDALEYLDSGDCTFWACEGPKRPQNMITCKRCWGIREIAKVRAALAKAVEQGRELR